MLIKANVLKQTSDCLGDDFVKLNILTYAIECSTQEVYNAKKHSMVVNGWGADSWVIDRTTCLRKYGQR